MIYTYNYVIPVNKHGFSVYLKHMFGFKFDYMVNKYNLHKLKDFKKIINNYLTSKSFSKNLN